MENNSVKIDKERAVELCEVVLDSFYNERKIFSESKSKIKMFPENQIVSVLPDDGLIKALWLFFSVLGDRKVLSDKYYEKIRKFYLENKTFFDPENLQKLLGNFDAQIYFISSAGFAYPKEAVKHISFNIEKLIAEFNYNPLNALTTDDFETSVKELGQFKGYGVGLASLYLIFLKRYGIRDTKNLCPKIDTHFLQISIACKVAEIEEGIRKDSLTKVLEKMYLEIVKENKFDTLALDSAFWYIGNELCNRKNNRYCGKCPINDYCTRYMPITDKDTTLHFPKLLLGLKLDSKK